MKVNKVAMSVRIVINLDDLDNHSAASAGVVGNELAEQISQYSRQQKLGYFPALDYFLETRQGVDEDLLEAADNLSWLAARLVREELRNKLRPVFASLRFDAMQNLAWSMPTVRPAQKNAQALLAEHYTPNVVKVDLTASMMQREDADKDLKRYTAHLVHRWLKDTFASVEVTSCRNIS